MNFLNPILVWLSRWIDAAAVLILAVARRFSAVRQLQLVEQPNGEFQVFAVRNGVAARAVGKPLRIAGSAIAGGLKAKVAARMAGAHIEMVLLPERFLRRPLELPRRAADFLEGVVRAQIDRLTPWAPGEAAFGWSAPAPAGADRIAVTVVATSKSVVAPLVQALSGRDIRSIQVTTPGLGEGAGKNRIRVFAQDAGSARTLRRLRIALAAALAAAGLAAALSVGAWAIAGPQFEADRLAAAKQFADLRQRQSGAAVSASDEAVAAIQKRKRETASSLLALEALSQALPDDTFLTEMRIEDGKLQVSGLTRDAPALIRLIEQSPHFTHATFYAPTTRAPKENGERFHIEARVEAVLPAAVSPAAALPVAVMPTAALPEPK